MAMYRALANLEKGERVIYAGSIFATSELGPRVTARLLEMGHIAQVSAPPVSVLPGWKTRANKLRGLKINTIDELLEAEDETISKLFDVSADKINAWKDEARRFLQAPHPPEG